MDIILYGNYEKTNNVDEIINTVKEVEMLASPIAEDRHYIAYLPVDYDESIRLLENFETLVSGRYNLVMKPKYVRKYTPNMSPGDIKLKITENGLDSLLKVSESTSILFLEIGDKLISDTAISSITNDFELSGTVVDSLSLKNNLTSINYVGILLPEVVKGIILATKSSFKNVEEYSLFNIKSNKYFKASLLKLNKGLNELSKTKSITSITHLLESL